MRKLIFYALLYSAFYHYAYIKYVHAVFDYAHYNYFPPTQSSFLTTYFLIIVPVIFHRKSNAPANFGASLLYAICFIPVQMALLFDLNQFSAIEILTLKMVLAGCMSLIFLCTPYGWRSTREGYLNSSASAMIKSLLLASLAILCATNINHMRLVGFEDVYALRAEATEKSYGTVVNYLLSWLTYCFIPYFFALAIVKRSVYQFLLPFLGSVLVYMATGAKSSILLSVIMLGLNSLAKAKEKILPRLLISFTAFIGLLIFVLPDDGLWPWVKSLFLVRTLATNGWVFTKYYEYFSKNGFTYYSHIGPVNALTHSYPYGKFELGQLIGIEYSGNSEANFNANFWASDGIAAFGAMGIPIISVALLLLFFIINRVSSDFSRRLVILWLTGFWLAFLNVPLATAAWSGGAVLTLMFLKFSKSNESKSQKLSIASRYQSLETQPII